MLKKVVISSNKIVQFHSHVFFIDLYEDNKSLEVFVIVPCYYVVLINILMQTKSYVEFKKGKTISFLRH